VLPYRLVWKTKCEEACFEGHRAFIIFENSERLHLYCPQCAEITTHTVRKDDPRVQRSKAPKVAKIFSERPGPAPCD
jgi:hypothetical protein